MRLFQWGEQYDVFSPQLDAEHRELFRLGGDLHQAILDKAPDERVNELLRGLAECFEGHFTHEERLMREVRYEAYEWHKRQHDGVRRRIKAFQQRVKGRDPKAAEELLEYLSAWLRDHTQITDRMMSAGLRAYERVHGPR